MNYRKMNRVEVNYLDENLLRDLGFVSSNPLILG
jgi:hypothetical protein